MAENASPTGQSRRCHEIDGLRGWAALSVVVFHMTWELFGHHLPWLRNVFTGFVLDGRLAVTVFFVLSGEALSAAFFRRGTTSTLTKLALKRVPRLSIPILAAALLTIACRRNGLFANAEAARIADCTLWLGGWLGFEPTYGQGIRYALFEVYMGSPQRDAIIPFLWTMKYELLGSIAVFAVLLGWQYLGRSVVFWLVLYPLVLLLDQTFYLSCFLTELWLARLKAIGCFDVNLSRRPMVAGITVAIVLLGVADVALNLDLDYRFHPFLAQLLVPLLYCHAPAMRVSRSKFSIVLGKLSFPLYLVQFPVLMAFSSSLIVMASHGGAPLSAAQCLAISVASISLSILLAAAFMPVEWLTARVGSAISAAVDRGDPARALAVASA